MDEVVVVALLSNERMFKGLLLDLDAIHRDTEVWMKGCGCSL